MRGIVQEVMSWAETHEGGDLSSEARIFLAMATEIVACQKLSGRAYSQPKLARARFAKTILCTDNAFLVIDRLIPSDLMVAHFRPGATIPLALRFSNASEAVHTDALPDMRGLAVRLRLTGERHHDLLLANRPAAPVRNARQLLAFALASLGDRETFLKGIPNMIALIRETAGRYAAA